MSFDAELYNSAYICRKQFRCNYLWQIAVDWVCTGLLPWEKSTQPVNWYLTLWNCKIAMSADTLAREARHFETIFARVVDKLSRPRLTNRIVN